MFQLESINLCRRMLIVHVWPVALRILLYANHERVNLIHKKQALSLAGRECTRCARAVPFGSISLFHMYMSTSYKKQFVIQNLALQVIVL